MNGQTHVQNGQIITWLDGIYGPVSPYQAWSEWLSIQDSPIPQSQERARSLRACLDEIGYLQ